MAAAQKSSTTTGQDSEETRAHAGHMVLWIDDAASELECLVRFLRTGGVLAELAVSGEAGLKRARTRAYDLILLDLRLPDMWGITVLEKLRSEGIVAPVLVLTGFGELDDVVAAMRLGAVDFLNKLTLDEETLLDGVRSAMVGGLPRAELARRHGHEPELLTQVLSAIASAQRVGLRPKEAGRLRQAAIARLVKTVAAPELGIRAFIRCAAALRLLVCPPVDSSEGQDEEAKRLVEHALETRGVPLSPKVRAAIARLELAAHQQEHLSEAQLATELAVDSSHLAHLLRSHTGFTFREWRWAVVVRHAARQLVLTDEHIAQISYQLGYEHPSQLDRDFDYVFGITPGQFRNFSKT